MVRVCPGSWGRSTGRRQWRRAGFALGTSASPAVCVNARHSLFPSGSATPPHAPRGHRFLKLPDECLDLTAGAFGKTSLCIFSQRWFIWFVNCVAAVIHWDRMTCYDRSISSSPSNMKTLRPSSHTCSGYLWFQRRQAGPALRLVLTCLLLGRDLIPRGPGGADPDLPPPVQPSVHIPLGPGQAPAPATGLPLGSRPPDPRFQTGRGGGGSVRRWPSPCLRRIHLALSAPHLPSRGQHTTCCGRGPDHSVSSTACGGGGPETGSVEWTEAPMPSHPCPPPLLLPPALLFLPQTQHTAGSP